MFHPEYAQPGGGSLPHEEYKRLKLEHAGMAADAAHHHEDVALKHRDAVTNYSIHSKPLNQHLINRKASLKRNHPSAVAKMERHHADLLKAVDEAPPTHAEMHVYSGIGFGHAQKILSRYREGDTLTTKAWTSASFKPDVAGKFAARGRDATDNRRVILHIHIPKGTKGVLHNEAASQYPNEQESIIKPGTKFKINKVYDHGERGPDEWGEHQHRRIISVSIVS